MKNKKQIIFTLKEFASLKVKSLINLSVYGFLSRDAKLSLQVFSPASVYLMLHYTWFDNTMLLGTALK